MLKLAYAAASAILMFVTSPAHAQTLTSPGMPSGYAGSAGAAVTAPSVGAAGAATSIPAAPDLGGSGLGSIPSAPQVVDPPKAEAAESVDGGDSDSCDCYRTEQVPIRTDNGDLAWMEQRVFDGKSRSCCP